MTYPCIVITRHRSGVYEWAVVYDQEKLGGDLPEASIEECLNGALVSLPRDSRLVEIRYRGVHMGTFDKGRVEDDTDEIATIVTETYGMLVHDN
jgi:hypothetical protein